MKLFFVDYDQDCCEKQCPCAAGHDVKASPDNDNSFNMFVKMFKPEGSENIQMEKSNLTPELSVEKQQEAEGLISEMMNRLSNIIAPNEIKSFNWIVLEPKHS